MRAAIYLRISQDRTGEEAGVTRQLEDCQALVAAMGWTLVETFTDNDVSASSGKVRKEYRRLLAAIKAGELDAIVAWHTDRLYRKLEDLQELIDAIEKQKVTVRTVQAGEVDLSTATGRGLARILGSISTMEGELKSERWRRSVRQRREQGQVHNFGPRLFGYHRDGTPNPLEADTVRWIAASLIEGQSIRGVTKKINDLGIPTTLGNPWSTQGLKGLIQNRRLTGASVLNGDVVGVGQWEAILDEETFEQVQAIFAVRRETGPRAPRVSLLLGLVRCGLCATPLKSGRLNTKRRVYRCMKPPNGQGCGKIAVGAEEVEEYVESIARGWLADAAVRARVEALASAAGGAVSEILELEARLRELETQLDEPGVPVQAITRAMQRTQEKINELHDAGAAVATPPLPIGDEWPQDLARRAQLVRVVVDRVLIDPAANRGSNVFDYDRIRVLPI
jgi:site-specific DNA recombinase